MIFRGIAFGETHFATAGIETDLIALTFGIGGAGLPFGNTSLRYKAVFAASTRGMTSDYGFADKLLAFFSSWAIFFIETFAALACGDLALGRGCATICISLASGFVLTNLVETDLICGAIGIGEALDTLARIGIAFACG